MPVPVNGRWFEDCEPGSVCEFGSIDDTEAEVPAVGRKLDPQVCHTDSTATCRKVSTLVSPGDDVVTALSSSAEAFS